MKTKAIGRLLKCVLCTAVLLHSSAFVEEEYGYYDQTAQRGARSAQPAGAGGGGFLGLLKMGVMMAGGYFVGNWHTKKARKSARQKHAQMLQTVWQASIQERDQLVHDKNYEIHALRKRLEEAYATIDQLENAAYEVGVDVGYGTLKGDYEEFKAPDADGDDWIDRSEFNNYVRAYMQAYPEIPLSDYPKFEEMDLNKDGRISFQEWQQYLFKMRLAEQEALQNMYKEAASAQNFDNLYEQLYAQLNAQQARR
mmetsp:Transcript_7498/g.11357  ORF Transcript_7498/g.11357 Transcript_7498/m.11357 type:complete len:253 (-) Transcript_7498:146-904(-)